MNKRTVKLTTLIALIKQKSPAPLLGSIFIASSIIILLPIAILLQTSFKEPYEKYNFKKIEQEGKIQTAKVFSIQDVKNVTINGEHPVRISYEYLDEGVTKSDIFQTMDLEFVRKLEPESKIKIKTYQNQSIIQGLKPFTFPFEFFYLLPLIFFLIGLPFLLIGLIPALRKFELYKHGIVKEGTIISFSNNYVNELISRKGNLLINYWYMSNNGKMIFGSSTTPDVSVMFELKPEDKIKLFVSEKDETKSCIVPKLEALKYNWEI